MNKQQLQREILEGMCECAEDMCSYYGMNIHFDGQYKPKSFKPGVSDKMLFNKLISQVVDNIIEELPQKANTKIIGISIS